MEFDSKEQAKKKNDLLQLAKKEREKRQENREKEANIVLIQKTFRGYWFRKKFITDRYNDLQSKISDIKKVQLVFIQLKKGKFCVPLEKIEVLIKIFLYVKKNENFIKNRTSLKEMISFLGSLLITTMEVEAKKEKNQSSFELSFFFHEKTKLIKFLSLTNDDDFFLLIEYFLLKENKEFFDLFLTRLNSFSFVTKEEDEKKTEMILETIKKHLKSDSIKAFNVLFNIPSFIKKCPNRILQINSPYLHVCISSKSSYARLVNLQEEVPLVQLANLCCLLFNKPYELSMYFYTLESFRLFSFFLFNCESHAYIGQEGVLWRKNEVKKIDGYLLEELSFYNGRNFLLCLHFLFQIDMVKKKKKK